MSGMYVRCIANLKAKYLVHDVHVCFLVLIMISWDHSKQHNCGMWTHVSARMGALLRGHVAFRGVWTNDTSFHYHTSTTYTADAAGAVVVSCFEVSASKWTWRQVFQVLFSALEFSEIGKQWTAVSGVCRSRLLWVRTLDSMKGSLMTGWLTSGHSAATFEDTQIKCMFSHSFMVFVVIIIHYSSHH